MLPPGDLKVATEAVICSTGGWGRSDQAVGADPVDPVCYAASAVVTAKS